MTTRFQRSEHALGGRWMAVGVVLLALATSFAAVFTDRLGDNPLILLTLPLALSAVTFGLRGGVAIALFESVPTSLWWVENAEPGGAPWLASRISTYLIIGVVIGWVVDSRAGLLRRLTNHSELSLDLIAVASFDGYFTQLNPAFSCTLGWTNEELMARPFVEFVHPDDREPTLRAVAEQTEQGKDLFHFQNRYRTKDGSYRWLEWTSRSDTGAKQLVAVARDVTERKRLEGIERDHSARLLKPGKLTTEEFRRMQEHVPAGAKLLSGSGSKVLQLAEEIALTHHERWDGTGYPHRLSGEEIPISGRIVAIADVFDALTHARPYKVEWPVEKAVGEIERLKGRQFDPAVVEAFAALDHDALLQPQRVSYLAIVA